MLCVILKTIQIFELVSWNEIMNFIPGWVSFFSMQKNIALPKIKSKAFFAVLRL